MVVSVSMGRNKEIVMGGDATKDWVTVGDGRPNLDISTS